MRSAIGAEAEMMVQREVSGNGCSPGMTVTGATCLGGEPRPLPRVAFRDHAAANARAAVIEHYQEFLRRFPTVKKLAAARESSVLAAWSGLGYYRERACCMRPEGHRAPTWRRVTLD